MSTSNSCRRRCQTTKAKALVMMIFQRRVRFSARLQYFVHDVHWATHRSHSSFFATIFQSYCSLAFRIHEQSRGRADQRKLVVWCFNKHPTKTLSKWNAMKLILMKRDKCSRSLMYSRNWMVFFPLDKVSFQMNLWLEQHMPTSHHYLL